MRPDRERLRVLFAAPAYWPALAFGGPIWMARELTGGLVRRGHAVEVVTTSLRSPRAGRTWRTRRETVAGVPVTYLSTPLSYRWFGFPPTVVRELRRLPRPDVAHVFGFRDPVTSATAAWCRRHGVPYVLEPLGMLRPRVRKVRLKRLLDATVLRGVVTGAARVVATSQREADELASCGVDAERIVVRGNGFPAPFDAPRGALRGRIGIGDEPLLLYVGRLAAGKGVELLLGAARRRPELHVALAGPDDGHGTLAAVERAQRDPATAGRVHHVVPDGRPLDLYGDADVFALPSAGESFGMAAAEAAAAGAAIVVSDRCGVAERLAPGGALVVPYEAGAVAGAVERLLDDPELRARLGRGAQEVAAANGWGEVVLLQERIYRDVLA